jgi:hypothetical protein
MEGGSKMKIPDKLKIGRQDFLIQWDNINFKRELEYYLYILNDESLTYQDKVEVLEEKIKERIKNM